MHKQYVGAKYLFLVIAYMVIIFPQYAYAQVANLTGKVTDKETGAPIPYVNIIIKNTYTGTTTDTAGNYTIKYPHSADTLIFSAIGYNYVEKVIPRTVILPSLSIQLQPETFDISEIKVEPDDGPMRNLFQKIQNHKDRNNPAKFQRYSYEKYTKWEYQINNIKDRIINSKIFRDNKNVFKTEGDSTTFLPLYFSEQLVFNEIQKNPSLQKSTVIADNTKGVGLLNDLEISGYTSALDIEVNYYDNVISLFSKNIISPIANNGWFYYKYFLADSMMVNGQKIYRVNYRPKRKGENTLKGYFLVENKYYSIMEIDGDLSETSNINFLKSLKLKNNYTFVNDTTPFFKRVQINALLDYVPFKTKNKNAKRLSLFYNQVTNIDKVTINPRENIKMLTPKAKYETIQLPDAEHKDSTFWAERRMEKLSESNKLASLVIDSISDIKSVMFADNIARLSVTDYYDIGKFELGPVSNFFNTNKVESTHFFIGARTSEEISDKMMFWGGLGYGTRNKKINASLGYGYKFPAINRRVIKLFYGDEMIRHGENDKILHLYENSTSASEDNIVSQLLKHDKLDEIFREQKAVFNFENEWYPGLINELSLSFIRHESPEFYPFTRNGNPLNSVKAFDLSLDTRFSREEKVIEKGFRRLYVGTDYPIIHLTVGGGMAYYDNESNCYGKLATTLKHHLNIGQSRLNYAVEAGAFFGKLPYTMLDIPRGNETFGWYRYDFNMLNYLEYVHDQYAHAFIDYHLNGFFLRRFPVLRQSGLREVFSAKLMVGHTSDKHQSVVEYPDTITKMKNPYVEVGAGLENILSMFRVEAIWRIAPESEVGAPSFGFRALFAIGL